MTDAAATHPDLLERAQVAIVRALTRRWRLALGVVLVAAIALRGLLVIDSPTPFGYVWDFYNQGVAVLVERGTLPRAADCWQCYHPPVFYVLGAPFLLVGRWIGSATSSPVEMGDRWLAGMALPCVAVTVACGYQLLRAFHIRGAALVTSVTVMLMYPCLFIASYGAEADTVLTAVMTMFVLALVRWHRAPASRAWRQAAVVGVIAGVAAATKFSGLVALVAAGGTVACELVSSRHRLRAVRDGVTMLALALAIGIWPYLANVRDYGTPLYANGSATAGLTFGERAPGAALEWTGFRLSALRKVFDPGIRGRLTDQRVYRNVPTTLHALGWSDMGFFSVPDRHGDPAHPYPPKVVPLSLITAVLVLGWLPEGLATVGLVLTLRRRPFVPLLVTGVVTMAAYVWWVTPQTEWALKTKYIAFLLPIGAVYLAVGLAWLSRRAPAAALAVSVGLGILTLATHAYLYSFARGGF